MGEASAHRTLRMSADIALEKIIEVNHLSSIHYIQGVRPFDGRRHQH